MKVAIDAQLTVGTATGIGEYVLGLLRALRNEPVEYVALSEPALDPWRFDRRVIWDQLLLPARARRAGAELLHCASGTVPFAPRLPVVATVHDMAWFRVQSHARAYARWYFGRFAAARYKHARALVVDSQFSRSELLSAMRVGEERVHVVYPGVARDYAVLQPAVSPEPFILVPGTVERRKNIEVLIRALAQLPSLRIVSVGPPTPYQDECAALAAELHVEDRVEFRGYVSREEVLRAYAAAAAVAVPSRYEGFGYAAAQALCAGVPLAVADASSLPEVTAGDALVVPPDDADAWAQALRSLTADSGARSRAAQKRAHHIQRFSWTASAEAMMRIYAHALGGG